MKRTRLEKHLRRHGCLFRRHGGNHDVWQHSATLRQTAVSRSKEIRPGTVRAVCKQLGVPLPDSIS